jgi:hypothetical protein
MPIRSLLGEPGGVEAHCPANIRGYNDGWVRQSGLESEIG